MDEDTDLTDAIDRWLSTEPTGLGMNVDESAMRQVRWRVKDALDRWLGKHDETWWNEQLEGIDGL